MLKRYLAHGFLLRGYGIFAVFLIIAAFVLLQLGERLNSATNYYLYPWAALVGLMSLVPSFKLRNTGQYAFYHPLVFGMFVSIIPGFVVGPIAIMMSMHDLYAYSLITEPQKNIPLALFYVMIGIGALWLGFSLPIGSRIGKRIFQNVPSENIPLKRILIPVLLLFGIGEWGTIKAIQEASFGYQISHEPSIWGQALLNLSSLTIFCQLILWFNIFRARKLGLLNWLCMAFLIVMAVINGILGGNKGGLFWQAVLVIGSYFLAGRKVSFKQIIISCVLVVPFVLFGVFYGNQFRYLKGSEQAVSAPDYIKLVGTAAKETIGSDWLEVLKNSGESIFRRSDITTHLAVVVSNYRRLAPLEEQYGIKNNIANYFITGFVPRFIWPEKPIISDTRSLSALYFNRSDNSYALTPFGDLLRNFGPIGVPVGMAVLGIFFAAIYQLVAMKPTSALRAGLYYALLTTVSFEGFYATIAPGMIRTMIVTGLAVLFVSFTTGRKRGLWIADRRHRRA